VTKHGHLVKDLKPGEITVTDDGEPQQIRSLRLRTGAEISTVQLLQNRRSPGSFNPRLL